MHPGEGGWDAERRSIGPGKQGGENGDSLSMCAPPRGRIAEHCNAMLSVGQSGSRSGGRSDRRIQAECCEWKAVAKLRKLTSMELGHGAAMQCTRGRVAGLPGDGAVARESREARVVTHCRCVPRRGGALQCIAMQCFQSTSRAADLGGDLTDGSKPSTASGKQGQRVRRRT